MDSVLKEDLKQASVFLLEEGFITSRINIHLSEFQGRYGGSSLGKARKLKNLCKIIAFV